MEMGTSDCPVGTSLASSARPRSNWAGAFPVTDWFVVAQAGSETDVGREAALESLLVGYLPLLKRYLTWRFRTTEDQAADWLHDFVLNKVLQRGLLRAADPARGRFRTFLLRALNNFVVQELRIAAHNTRYRREVWQTADGQTIDRHEIVKGDRRPERQIQPAFPRWRANS